VSARNGHSIFDVSAAPAVRERVRRLVADADANGYGRQLRQQIRTAFDMLRLSARSFGEPVSELPHLPLQVRTAVVQFVCVNYAVHYDRPLVFIREIRILGLFD